MPIKSLTSRQARFPMLGKIRKGASMEGRKSPADLDYFRMDSDIKYYEETLNTELTLAEKFHGINSNRNFPGIYGAKPKQIDVLLPFPTTEQVFPCWMEEWNKTSLIRRCDEEIQHIYEQNGKMIATKPIPCLKASGEECNCKQVGRLSVVLPKLGEMGYFEVETHSKWDIISLTEQLQAVEMSAGSLLGIPFLLERTPREISYPLPGGKRGRKIFNLLSIRVHPDRASQVLQVIETRAFQQFAGVAPLAALQSADPEPIEVKAIAPAENPPAPDDWEQRKHDAIKWATKEGLTISEATDLAVQYKSRKKYFEEAKTLLASKAEKAKKIPFTAEEIVGDAINSEISAEVDAMIEDGLLEVDEIDEAFKEEQDRNLSQLKRDEF